MKKLMFAMAIAATVGFAQAEDTPIVTTFDDLTVSNKFDFSAVGYTDWSAPGSEGRVDDTMVLAYDPADANNPNYLQLDGVQNLAKNINTAIGDGLYIDTMVKFTASEDAPTPSEGDKLVVWLKETPGENDNPTTYTLMVTAGFFNTEEVGFIDRTEVHSYPTDAQVNPNNWYNLKVQALADVDPENICDEYPIPGFLIYINNTLVKTVVPTATTLDSYGETKYVNITDGTCAIFPTLVREGSAGSDTITQLAFSGSGAIDTVGAFQGNCDPDVGPTTYAVTYSQIENATVVTDPADTTALAAGTTVAFTVTPAENYEYATTPSGWTAGANGAITMTYTVLAEGENVVTIPAPTAKSVEPTTWPTGDDLDKVEGKTAAETFGISGTLANVDAKVFATWASGNGGITYADKGTVTINENCFLLNIANNASEADIKAAEDTAKEAIKITAISFDENGDPVLTIPDPATYGNGKIVVEGSAQLPAAWHNKVDTDKFFRTKLVPDEVAAPAVGD